MDIFEWDGGIIDELGCYSGILLECYYNDQNLLLGFFVFKLNVKEFFLLEGNLKVFWKMWFGNLNWKCKVSIKVMDFGCVVYVFIFGDEVFEDKFVVCFECVDGEIYYGVKIVWKCWYCEQEFCGFMVIIEEDIEKIWEMVEDFVQNFLVFVGGLWGDVEVFMFVCDLEIGIWLKSCLDNWLFEGMFVDVKMVVLFDQVFLEKQFYSVGYYIQVGMMKMVSDFFGELFYLFIFFYI